MENKQKLYSKTIQIYLLSKNNNEHIFQQQLTEGEIYEKLHKCSSKLLLPISSIKGFQTSNGNFTNTEIIFEFTKSIFTELSNESFVNEQFDHININKNADRSHVLNIIDEIQQNEKEMIIYIPKSICYCLYPSNQYEILDHCNFCLLRVHSKTLTEMISASSEIIDIEIKYSAFIENSNENGHYNFHVSTPIIENYHQNVKLCLTMISAHEFKKYIIINNIKYVENENELQMENESQNELPNEKKYEIKLFKELNDEIEITEKNEILYKQLDIISKKENFLKKYIDIVVRIEEHLMISSILCDDKQSPFILDETKSFSNLSTKRTDYFGGYLNIYNVSNLTNEEQHFTSCIFVFDFIELEKKQLTFIEQLIPFIQSQFSNNQIMTEFNLKVEF